jgi:acyl-CoA dehydrogenase
MIQRTVRGFVKKKILMLLDQQVLRNEREGRPGITREEIH